ncbi:DUF1007 family protein [Alsobacter sp. SYSU M60028]|uniref:DUF1007 family protein n=1 Tax=Alsobacter ponti TaxID=2962936 RepID=A0ABT1L7B1_9HYPH|nr:DUF1007 family protein [Alsobacter ponti]MCP8937347.1 DUF1007 family protein [Alsobacter ponti]
MFRHLIFRACLIGLALIGAPQIASAHPHVWVSVRAEIVYGTNGRITAIRHNWTFDEAYTSFAVQGLDANHDGVYSREELAELAKVNTESLAEVGFFTVLKADGKRLDFANPVDGVLDYDGSGMTLRFTLPLKQPALAKRVLTLDVADPSFFVDFSYPEEEKVVSLAGAPAGCAVHVTRPDKPDFAKQKLGEDYFANANMGLQFASRAFVACP